MKISDIDSYALSIRKDLSPEVSVKLSHAQINHDSKDREKRTSLGLIYSSPEDIFQGFASPPQQNNA